MQCFEDDVVDVCTALEEFLNLRVERGCDFYHKLKRIDVSITALDDARRCTEEETEERNAAARRLQAYCDDLKLASIVDDKEAAKKSAPPGHKDGVSSFTDAKRYTTKARSMTI